MDYRTLAMKIFANKLSEAQSAIGNKTLDRKQVLPIADEALDHAQIFMDRYKNRQDQRDEDRRRYQEKERQERLQRESAEELTIVFQEEALASETAQKLW